MADDSDKQSKRDELRIMKLINEGKDRVGELDDSLDWTRDRIEDTLEDLKSSKYVKSVSEGGDEVLKITDRGMNQIPKLLNDVAEDTRDFVDSVAASFQKRVNKVLPKVELDVTVKDPEDEE